MENIKKTLIMTNGQKHDVVSEDGKYFYCRKTQFKKSNPNIVKVTVQTISNRRNKKEPEKPEMSREKTGENNDTESLSTIL